MRFGLFKKKLGQSHEFQENMPATRRPRSFAITNGGPKYKKKRVAYRPAAGQMVISRGPRAFSNQEVKFFDIEHVANAFSTTWNTEEPATTNLTAVAQGDGESNRDGRKYIMTSIHLKGFLSTIALEAQTAPLNDIICRLVLVHDTQTNGAQLTATDVMDGAQTDDVNSFRNLQFTNRFKVLWDETIIIVRNNTNEGASNLFAAAATKSPAFKVNKSFNIPVLMSGTGADIANVTDNSIHLIAVADSSAALMNYQCRLRFTG